MQSRPISVVRAAVSCDFNPNRLLAGSLAGPSALAEVLESPKSFSQTCCLRLDLAA